MLLSFENLASLTFSILILSHRDSLNPLLAAAKTKQPDNFDEILQARA